MPLSLLWLHYISFSIGSTSAGLRDCGALLFFWTYFLCIEELDTYSFIVEFSKSDKILSLQVCSGSKALISFYYSVHPRLYEYRNLFRDTVEIVMLYNTGPDGNITPRNEVEKKVHRK